MSADELQELHEHAEHAAHHPDMAPVSLTMAILAVVVAVISLMGHRTHTEELMLQTETNDKWAYYQGKDTRLHTDQKLVGMAGFLAASDQSKEAAWVEATKAEAEKYQKDKDKLQAEANKLQEETGVADRRTDRYDLGEVFLEIALVVTSITLLSGKRMYWYLGMAIAIIGLITAGTVVLVR